MAFKLPWSNFHELNLDWILEKIKELREDVDNITGSATPYTSTPEMDGIGSPGTQVSYSRGDHRHPTDTSRASAADLAQEILDRDGADNTLQANIDATDAKIKFSSSAPFMDSSSASAGFSDYMARADHVHPTDTSRASATDLATLTARVDAFSGSAAPSDATPLMDGVGAAGTGGNYSRGDHVHPRDTSKLDTAGGTVTGRITNTIREQYVTVNATGWLRVADVPNVGGTCVRINVMRRGTLTPDECHGITLAITQNAIEFLDELSAADVVYINKIRYTSAGKVDIHVDQTAESKVGVFIEPLAATTEDMDNIKSLAITSVADSPIGETILVDYTLSVPPTPSGKTTLYTGWDTTGTIALSDSINNYDMLLITCVTNVDTYCYTLSPDAYYGNNWVLTAASGPVAGGFDFAASLGIVPSNDGESLTISTASNNPNWMLHLYKVQGIKI